MEVVKKITAGCDFVLYYACDKNAQKIKICIILLSNYIYKELV